MNEEIIVKIGADISGLAADLKKAQADITGLGGTVEDLEQSGTKGAFGIGKILTAIGLVALSAGAFKLVKNSISDAFGRIDTMESFERVMSTITGSTEETEKALDKTRESVTGTAFGLDVAAKSVQNFVTRGMDVDKATDTMAAWGDAVAFYGDGSNAQLASVTDALAKMQTKGTVEMDQMNRLFDAGIDAVGMYATATGRSASDVQDDLSAGAISSEDFIDTVTKAMSEGTNGVVNIAGAAKEAGASWGASFDNMKAAVTRGVVNIIEEIDEMLTSNGLPDMREMVAEFGRKFEEALNWAVEKIPAVVDSIKSVYDALKPWLPLIGAVTAGVGAVIFGISAFNSVKGIIQGIQGAFLLLNGTIWANPITWVVAAFIAAAILIFVYWEPIKEFFINLWESIKEVFSAVFEWIDEKTNGAFSSFVGIISEYMAMAWENIKAVWEWIKESFTNVLDFLKALVTGDFQGMKDAISNQMENSRKLISTIWDNIKVFFRETLSQIWATVVQKFNEIKASIETKMNEAKSALVAKFTEMVSGAISKGAAIVTAVKSAFAKVYNGIKDKLVESVTEVGSQIGKMPGKIKESVSDMVTAGGDLIAGVIKGITGKIGEGLTAIGGFAKGLLARFKKDTDTKSPSRAFADISKWFAPGVVSGIDQTAHLAIDSVSGLASDITRSFNPELEIPEVVKPTMSYATPNANYGSLSAALSGEVNVNQRDSMLIGAIASLEDKLTNLRVDMDGQKVGSIVRPHVNSGNAVDDVTRYF